MTRFTKRRTLLSSFLFFFFQIVYVSWCLHSCQAWLNTNPNNRLPYQKRKIERERAKTLQSNNTNILIYVHRTKKWIHEKKHGLKLERNLLQLSRQLHLDQLCAFICRIHVATIRKKGNQRKHLRGVPGRSSCPSSCRLQVTWHAPAAVSLPNSSENPKLFVKQRFDKNADSASEMNPGGSHGVRNRWNAADTRPVCAAGEGSPGRQVPGYGGFQNLSSPISY